MGLGSIKPHSLVVYRGRPARVLRLTDKLEIELPDGNRAKVRLKDVLVLHPGPVERLNGLSQREGDVKLAWEMLLESGEGSVCTLEDLAALIYGEFTPSSAWAAWEHVQEGIYFQGRPEAIAPRAENEVHAALHARQVKQEEARRWESFLARLESGRFDPLIDRPFLREVEDLAYARRKQCRVLRHLGRSERPENAHALLLALGYWDETVNPYPQRFRVEHSIEDIENLELPEEARLDLTHLPAFAIDDPDNQDPDDALSLEELSLDRHGGIQRARLWIHVADVAAWIRPDEAADLEARARGATLYLPEGQVPMLPPNAIRRLGLGLQKISPALSFHVELDALGKVTLLSFHPSLVQVERMSYEQVEAQLERTPWRELWHIAHTYQERRRRQGALFIDMPEVIVRVVDGEVRLLPLERLRSRDLVREWMLMAGEAVADYARQHAIPLPFVVQEAVPVNGVAHVAPLAGQAVEGAEPASWPNLALAYAVRRSLPRSQVSTRPAAHGGIGLPHYCRATSPLRRYLDLVVHQQLRLHLHGKNLMGEQKILELIGAVEGITSSLAQVEALSRRHWTLVYLQRHPGWQGVAVLVEQHETRGRVILPMLALEADVFLPKPYPLNQVLTLELLEVNLPELEAHFRMIRP